MLLLSGFEDSSEMSDQVHVKVLVPSIAAGAIIGKGGETITQIQKETGANIKMSKANDFYPGEIFFPWQFEVQKSICACVSRHI